MSLVPNAVVEAYRNARYDVAAGSGETIGIRIGEANAALDELLLRLGAAQGAILTAYNPASVPLCEAENQAAHENLLRALDATGLAHLPTRGVDPAGDWPDEPGFLVLAISREAAIGLAQTFDQNGFVFCRRGHTPELVLVR